MATNPIVEAEEDFDNIDNVEDLTQRLGQELKSEEEQVTEQPPDRDWETTKGNGMKELKITKGEWELEEKPHHGLIMIGVYGYVFAEVYANEYETSGECEANANLIAEAGNVANETGLTPRELLEQRNELLEALKEMVRVAKNYEVGDYSTSIYNAYELSESAINKANGKG